ncbi:MAG: 50S ribosomal protein L28, partial [Treponemataceae bacterium]|nr:50S ribosomal protein L28 [Treponemataceae bacterium]
MMRRCDICGKGSQHGNRVSKTYHHTRHVWLPNLH